LGGRWWPDHLLVRYLLHSLNHFRKLQQIFKQLLQVFIGVLRGAVFGPDFEHKHILQNVRVCVGCYVTIARTVRHDKIVETFDVENIDNLCQGNATCIFVHWLLVFLVKT